MNWSLCREGSVNQVVEGFTIIIKPKVHGTSSRAGRAVRGGGGVVGEGEDKELMDHTKNMAKKHRNTASVCQGYQREELSKVKVTRSWSTFAQEKIVWAGGGNKREKQRRAGRGAKGETEESIVDQVEVRYEKTTNKGVKRGARRCIVDHTCTTTMEPTNEEVRDE